jgi:hypothetical protein
MMNDLEKYFTENTGRLIHKWQHYFEIYDRHFARFRNTDVCVLEFGVAQGGSLQMWKEYFGAKAKIIGVDINPHCKSLAKAIPRIDVLIDDGGHTMKQQINTFEELFAHIDVNGVYLCEDMHTAYWRSYGGGHRRSGSFIEYTKNFIDYINAWHSEQRSLRVTEFTKAVHSLHYYDSILAIEKRKMDKPFHHKTGSPSIPDYKGPTSLTLAMKLWLKQELDRRRGAK